MDAERNTIRVIGLPLGDVPSATGYYALGLLHAYAKAWQNERLKPRFEFSTVKPYGRADIPGLLQTLGSDKTPAIYLFSSFSWTHDLNTAVAQEIRKMQPNALIIFGGAHIPREKNQALQFISEHTAIDIAVLGEGEETFAKILDSIILKDQSIQYTADLSGIPGLTYRTAEGSPQYTGSAPRITDLDSIPSPYLNDVFDDSVYKTCVITETTRGCPFGCTFCDWGGYTASKVRKFDMSRIKAEMEFFASKKVEFFFYCDANFGSLKRDIEIADLIVESHEKTGFPKNFHVSYAKNATEKVAYIVEKLYEKNIVSRGTIAFQTRDQSTLEKIDRGNIKTSSFESLLVIFKRKNIPITCDLLIGMPGQTYEKYADDLAYLFETMVFPASYLVRVLPNAPMATDAYQKQHAMKLNDRGNVISTESYSEDEWRKMIRLKFANDAAIQEGFLKYILYFLQIEHGVHALSLLDSLLDLQNQSSPSAYPLLQHFMARMQNWSQDEMTEFLPITWAWEDSHPILSNLTGFYADVFRFIRDHCDADISSSEESSLTTLQIALVQRPNRSLPETKNTAHDVIAYFAQLQGVVNISVLPETFKPLKAFGAGQVHTPAQKIPKRAYIYTRPPADGLPNWPLKIEGLRF